MFALSLVRCYAAPQVAPLANDNSAFIPAIWAREGLMILVENMVMANLVHRDFEPEVARYGDVVNTRRPGEFKIRRKTDADDVVSQDASATNVQVPLDQWFYNSFIIKDGERSKSMQELLEVYMLPAMQVIARSVDRVCAGRIHAFFGAPTARTGRLLNLSSTTAQDYTLEARQILNANKAPDVTRSLLLAPSAETAFLKTALFVNADQRGDGGSALESSRIGRLLGFDTYMSQNVADLSATAFTNTATGTITSAKAAGAGGSQSCTITGYVVNVGEYAVVAGNDQPTYITAETDGSGNTTAITLNEVNKNATLSSAAVTVYKKGDVQGAYAAKYAKGIIIDGLASGKPLVVGQLLGFGTSTRYTYTVVEVDVDSATQNTVHLDRPLDALLADNDLAFPGPCGSINWAFQRNCLALVTRPLAAPPANSGAMSAVVNFNNVAMRVVMQYDSVKQGTRVNMDILGGVAVLDSKLCVPFLG